jgi:hypothetical protein
MPREPERDFAFDLAELQVPAGTTLVVLVNPNNPNGGVLDMRPLPELLRLVWSLRTLVEKGRAHDQREPEQSGQHTYTERNKDHHDQSPPCQRRLNRDGPDRLPSVAT